ELRQSVAHIHRAPAGILPTHYNFLQTALTRSRLDAVTESINRFDPVIGGQTPTPAHHTDHLVHKTVEAGHHPQIRHFCRTGTEDLRQLSRFQALSSVIMWISDPFIA